MKFKTKPWITPGLQKFIQLKELTDKIYLIAITYFEKKSSY